jgi:hypothetical protein
MLSATERIGAWISVICGFSKEFSPRALRKENPRRDAPLLVAFLANGLTAQIIGSVARESGWALTFANNPEAAMGRGSKASPAIILFERDFHAADWQVALRCFKHWSPRPYVVLLSLNTDLNPWDELERVGGSDLVRLPLDREHLIWSVGRATALWHGRREVQTSGGPYSG